LTHCPLFLIGKGRNTETLTTEGKSRFEASAKKKNMLEIKLKHMLTRIGYGYLIGVKH
jgi:hypothetical protein